MTEGQRLRVAIVGGGMGGVFLAATLSHLGADASIQVDLYESAQQITQVGAGITLWPRGWELLKDLGMEDDLAALLVPGQEIPTKDKIRLAAVMKKSDQAEDVDICNVSFPGGSVSFHRADVLGVLLKHVSPRINTHLGHRLASFQESDNDVKLSFQNGTTAHCDILVGADGINSMIRRSFLSKYFSLSGEDAEREGRPLWTGTTVYRCIIDSERIARLNPKHPSLSVPVSHCGKNKHIISYPMSGGKAINVVAFVTDPEKENTLLEGPSIVPQSVDDVSAFYNNWSQEVKCITDNLANPSRWAVERVRPLEKYGAGRIALLGDAAHAMPPHLGNGAGQAFEDAYVLAHLIHASCTRNSAPVDITKVIRVYSAVRQPFGNFVAQASVDQGKNYELANAELADVREGDTVSPERLAELGKRVAGSMEWMWATSLKDDLVRALGML